jgi:hypothetical protein
LSQVIIAVIVDTSGVHEPSGYQGESGRDHQLGVELHQLGEPLGRLLGLVKVEKDWIEHRTHLASAARPPSRLALRQTSVAAFTHSYASTGE